MVNDTCGHAQGDAVIRRVARLLAENTRKGRFVARLGGDEFAVALPGAGAPDAAELLERFMAALASDPGQPRVTVSVGVAGRADGLRNIEDLLARADDALYAAKRAGRARVRCWHDAPPAQSRLGERRAALNRRVLGLSPGR